LYGAQCWIQCVGNDVVNVGMSQSSCHVDPTDSSLKTMEHLQNLAGLSYHTHLIVRIWGPSDVHLFGPIKDGLRGQNSGDIDAVIAAVRKTVVSAGADSYERNMRTLAHRCENAWPMVVTI
jgi:hypothetical protein